MITRYHYQVSAVTENVVSQESVTNATDFDDDDGGGLVGPYFII